MSQQHEEDDHDHDHCEEDPHDALEDQMCFLRTVKAFGMYYGHSFQSHTQRMGHMQKLPQRHKDMLNFDIDRLAAAEAHCLQANAIFFDSIIKASSTLFESYWPEAHPDLQQTNQLFPSALDIDKTYSTLRQFVRDWGAEGYEERNQCYAPILQKLDLLYPNRSARPDMKVLVPGAGLSRLSFEIALRGFSSQGNEFSYHMLIAGHYILNHVMESEVHPIYAFVDTSVNNLSRGDQMRCTMIPDTSPSEMMQKVIEDDLPVGDFSMIAGEFVEVYSKPQQLQSWQCVVTCFFIDTAHNIIEYIETIFNLLVSGGHWINLGPLLYHFTGMPDESSVDLSYEEVKHVVQAAGFIVEEEQTLPCTYTNNGRSMKQNIYHTKFFVAKK
eukprot:PhF_6_TR9159/c0_g1_i1/m.14245/K19787/CARNMT1; carnosine N-methyltransferase